jgi:hypothetical protein
VGRVTDVKAARERAQGGTVDVQNKARRWRAGDRKAVQRGAT